MKLAESAQVNRVHPRRHTVVSCGTGRRRTAAGRRVLVADPGETSDDLVRDMIEMLISMCARLYGRYGARNRAMRAVTSARNTGAEASAAA